MRRGACCAAEAVARALNRPDVFKPGKFLTGATVRDDVMWRETTSRNDDVVVSFGNVWECCSGTDTLGIYVDLEDRIVVDNTTYAVDGVKLVAAVDPAVDEPDAAGSNFDVRCSLTSVCTHGASASSDGSVASLPAASIRTHLACETSNGCAYADVTSSIPTSLAAHVPASTASVARSTAPGASSPCNYCCHVV